MNRDEQIAAYIDGSMTADERAVLEAQMAGDAEMADAIARRRKNDELLRVAYAPTAAGIDAAMLKRLGLADEAQAPVAANDNVFAWRRWLPAGGAIAASLALALVFVTPSGDVGGGLAGQPAFQAALENMPSGGNIALNDGRQIRPVLTFKAGDGRYCREFSVGGSQSGIACRGPKSWNVEAFAKGSVVLPGNTEIRTAAGADTKALDAAYDRLKASDPVSGEIEKQMISKKWQKKSSE